MGGKGGGKKTRDSDCNREPKRQFAVPRKLGGGLVRMSINRDMAGVVHGYSFAYINPQICALDNGRVLGYDNRHGYHHRHFMGTRTAVSFTSVEELRDRFEAEWRAIAMNFVKGA